MDHVIHFAVSAGVAGVMAWAWLRFCTHHGI
jgi:hypothetical protein